MAKVEWSPGIEHVSGALCKPGKNGQHTCTRMLLGTHRVAATTSPDCNRLYMRKKVDRSTPVTSDELFLRTRFATVARAVRSRSMNLSMITTDQMNFIAQRSQLGGKKTFKAYLWKLELQSYDAQHPQG